MKVAKNISTYSVILIQYNCSIYYIDCWYQLSALSSPRIVVRQLQIRAFANYLSVSTDESTGCGWLYCSCILLLIAGEVLNCILKVIMPIKLLGAFIKPENIELSALSELNAL